MKKFFKIFVFLFVGLSFASAQKNDSLLSKKIIDSVSVDFQNRVFKFNTIKDTTKGIEVKTKSLLGRKGAIFVFYGWNRAAYSNSDIHFSGNGYNFQLNNVAATDRPTKFGLVYFDPAWFTVTQYNFRMGYFIKDNLALVLGIDHMKYVMKQNQTVNFSGTISDPKYAGMVNNGQVNLADEQFLTFEHTDGLNYENLGLEKYKNISSRKNINLVWSYGAGIGVMFPKSNIKLFGNERSDRFHVAGIGTDVRASLNALFWNHWIARVEGKFGYVNMWDIKTTLNNKPDKAQQDFVFGQILAGIGYTFNTKKQK